MEKPISVEFVGNCLKILQKNLLSVAPEEGCALLLGKDPKKSNEVFNCDIRQVNCIWPCRNIWTPELEEVFGGSPKESVNKKLVLSKNNRYFIDPIDQLKAQKWARKHQMIILGSAHSHPKSNAVPSMTDINRAISTGIVVIVNLKGQSRAWWIDNRKKNSQPFELNIHASKKGKAI